jgi:hypothetical protein
MTTKEKIEPALAPEEWASGMADREVMIFGERYGLKSGLVLDDGEAVGVSGRDRHAVAAFALYGQPYGFTWEDVQLLRSIAKGPNAMGNYFIAGLHPRAADLADRIAALLPPAETTR